MLTKEQIDNIVELLNGQEVNALCVLALTDKDIIGAYLGTRNALQVLRTYLDALALRYMEEYLPEDPETLH